MNNNDNPMEDFRPILFDAKRDDERLLHLLPRKRKRVAKLPKFVRRFRLRLLPIISYQKPRLTPTLPPINLQLLKEIDLHEILKNPQLRHDIMFDPQLQFRPNLDGERGRRKKAVIEKYWLEMEAECRQFYTLGHQVKLVRLPVLFTTLRDILLLLLPVKDRAPVNEIMDVDLLVQPLSHGLFDYVAMAVWLGDVFKLHCAPMRDQWVLDMISKFRQAYEENLVAKLVSGLRMVFSILEAMKLDVANHQIRMLRPVLIDTAVDFEKDYFDSLISHGKIDISDSLRWFAKYKTGSPQMDMATAIVQLLSCRNMAAEFPSTLAFDHTRLVFLRADVRQLVCVQLCVVLFKQLCHMHGESCSPQRLQRVQEEIVAIVTDYNGNVKWTRNVQAIALQLVRSATGGKPGAAVPQKLVDFAYSWLVKQIQPTLDVYGLMEDKMFREMLAEIAQPAAKKDSELGSIAARVATLVKFHWSVFGDYYERLETARQ